jgi:ubiquinone/menaquinone biosynthesis C-methylase UbiE
MIPKADASPEPKSEARRVQDFFQGYAQDFDSIYKHNIKRGFLGRLIDNTFRKSMFLRFQEVLQHTADPRIQTILDVGCGSGRYSLEFLKQGKRVVGMDLAEGMLELARQAVAGSPLAQNISFIQGDYLQHEFHEGFDAACLMGFLDYIQDPAAVFRKLRREVTKELYASFPRSSGLLAKQRKLRYALRSCPLYLYSARDIRAIMEACGLEKQYVLKDLGREYFVKVML